MGNTVRRRDGQHSVIPDDVKVIFEQADIATVFEYLEITFHVSKKWRARYRKELEEVSRSTNPQEYFCQFIREHIEPSINKITLRQDTLFALIRYLLKHKLEEKKLQESYQKRYYKSGSNN